MINNVVEARLQNLQHRLAGDTATAQRFFIDAAKLLFHQAVEITELLLLDQAEAVIGVLAARLRAVDAGAVVAAFKIF